MTIFYDIDCGSIRFHYGHWPSYLGYSKREAFSRFRKAYGLERKHIRFVNEADAPSLMECIAELTRINKNLAALNA
ncbi:hypothetical protein [uncultured Alistipes sp.]|uniref:hypothetical protein n=1 Tax=uncultured Alistipes sp. TaxID=538949 RepID=UPI00272A3447|nr:hypothetical protein [uncultured Alistipes sp.]